FPTLFSIALDYLPIQGTSVSCKWVFSSAALTATPRKNCLSADIMEALQILKFSARRDGSNLM
ncbi:hypothetical protein SERLA73DRAFT_28458, partial [Serpula lacrymans var. lacrymans S7.3]